MGPMSMLGMALLLAVGLDTPDTKSLGSARVIVPTAEVRCKASLSPDIYVTNQLRQGDTVEVLEQLPATGWRSSRRLAPLAGSTSISSTRPGRIAGSLSIRPRCRCSLAAA